MYAVPAPSVRYERLISSNSQGVTPTFERRELHEQVGGSIALVLVIVTGRVPRFQTVATSLAVLTIGVSLATTPVLAAARHGGGGSHHVAGVHRGGGAGLQYAGHRNGGGGGNYGGGGYYSGGGYYGGCNQGYYNQAGTGGSRRHPRRFLRPVSFCGFANAGSVITPLGFGRRGFSLTRFASIAATSKTPQGKEYRSQS